MNSKSIFTNIYKNQIWGDGSLLKPFSGSGSNPVNAAPYAKFVKETISDYKITSVVDLGHGDWVMWGDYRFLGVNYCGLDIAEGLSNQNSIFYNSSNLKFIEIKPYQKLPESELLISKDVLQHLSFNEIDFYLNEFRKYKYIILCNDIFIPLSFTKKLKNIFQVKQRLIKLFDSKNPFYKPKVLRNNVDIQSGDYRGLDLDKLILNLGYKNFQLIRKLQFDGPARIGIKKEVLLYINVNIV